MTSPTLRLPTDLVRLLGPGELHAISIPPKYVGGRYEPYVDSPKQRARLYPQIAKRHGKGVQVAGVELLADQSARVTLWMPESDAEPTPWIDAQRITLGPDVKQFDPQAESFASESGRTVVKWELDVPQRDNLGVLRFRNHVIAAKMAPFDRWLRKRIAAYLKCREDEVVLSSRWEVEEGDDKGVISQILITESPLIIDPKKRREQWQGLIDETLPVTPGASWRIEDMSSEAAIRLVREIDPLASGFTINEFIDRYRDPDEDPRTSWKKFPIAIRESGEAVLYTTFMTLICGQTGSGKSSPVWSIISGLLPAMREGWVELYAIDPKNAEAKAAPGLFEKIATEPEQWDELLEEMVRDLKARQGTSGRSFRMSEETPLRILFIDELSALAALDVDRQRAARVDQNLAIILSQGRSGGTYVLSAVQSPQKEMIGRTRQFYACRVALRTETALETDLILGPGSADQGALSHAIEPANEGNNYRTAGTGWMRVEGEAEPVRVRFPFTDDDTLQAWSDEFAALRAERDSAKAPAVEEVELAPVDVEDSFWDDGEDESAPTETPTHSLPKPEPAPVPAATDDDEGEWEE